MIGRQSLRRCRGALAQVSRLALGVALLAVGGCNWSGEEWAKKVVARNTKARNTGSEANILTIGRILEDYYTEAGSYPVGDTYEMLNGVLSPNYIHVLPAHDAWGYRYRYHSDGKSYRLISVGQDGREATADDIVVGSRNQ